MALDSMFMNMPSCPNCGSRGQQTETGYWCPTCKSAFAR
jgi:DNA-directed RNA polymerase subunit RPC12/RpoP